MSVILENTVKGIPCQIRVDQFYIQPRWKGSPHTCPSSDDYYGYTEVNYTVLDRRGREAPWLEKKITADEDKRICDEIEDYYLTNEEGL